MSVSAAYNYTGQCADRATMGRIDGSNFQTPVSGGKVLHTIDLTAPEVFHYSAEIDTDDDPKKAPDTQVLDTSKVKYKGEQALHLRGTPAAKSNPSINPAEPNPYIGGLGVNFPASPVTLTANDYVQIRVFPTTSAALILEIYEDDGGNPNEIDKYPANYWLPKKDDDFYKAVVQLKPTGKWQTISIPLSKFVDWNKKTSCSTPIPGINENVGNGKFDPKKGEAMAFQLTFVSDSWGPAVKEVYVGQEVKFIRKGGEKK
ncbi:MAG: hypothetical protein KKA31_00125 [Candidatus Margulisbacteria bacterium]|nr:hypothetical protein [Candidatus Margulisiibacteriota bacterium]